MVKRAIGLDFNPSHIHAVQMSRRAEGFHVEKTFFDDHPGQWDTPAQWIQFLFSEHGFDRRATVACSIPHDRLFFRREQTDYVDKEIDDDTLSADIQDAFPLPAEDKVTAVCCRRISADHTTNELVTTVARSTLEAQLAMMEKSKARSTRLEASIFAVFSSIATNHPEILAGPAILVYTETARILIAVTENEQILCVRNLPSPCRNPKDEHSDSVDVSELLLREIELTWRSGLEEKIPETTPLILAGRAAADPELRNDLGRSLPCRIFPVEPLARAVGSVPQHPDSSFCLAEGLALRALRPDTTVGVNLLQSQALPKRNPIRLKKQVTYSFILLGVIATVYLGGIFFRLAKLEGQHSDLQSEIRQVFLQALPEEKTIVNELAQMQTHLQEYQERSGLWRRQSSAQADPLDVLHTITIHTPSNLGITIQDLLITGKTVRLTAVCNSFQDAYGWQRILQKQTEFASVDMQYPKKPSSSDAVQFVMVLELETEL